MRYAVDENAHVGHGCCYRAAVFDTTKPVMIADEHYKDSDGAYHYDVVCECPTKETAQMIADALNRSTFQ